MMPLHIAACTATSCIGSGLEQTLRSLREGRSGLMPCSFGGVDFETQVGEVPQLEQTVIQPSLRRFDCRNNRLAQLALEQDEFAAAVERSAGRWGPRRVGVFLGTSTSGILETEQAYQHRDPVSGALPDAFDYAGTQSAYSVADFARRLLRLEGPAGVVCTACSSSAKVFGSAQRMIAAGMIDAAVVGGVDSLCLTTLYGFHALQLTSPQRCRPFDVARDGISIGEAAAFALLERTPTSLDGDAVLLAGIGESSDAYHMSSPHPQGRGAGDAMRAALSAAALSASQIDYVNLHGTATRANDSAECAAVIDVLGTAVPCSSTKGATGHTLGAAGALEAVISTLALRHGLMPGGLNTTAVDPQLGAHYLCENRHGQVSRVLSNSFGFGGANCTLALIRAN